MIFGRTIERLVSRARPKVGQTPGDVVFTENKMRLVRYRARPEGIAHPTPILIVPSLINRHYVLDLLPGKSFVEDMVRRGHDVYVIQWGTPGDEDRFIDFDTVCDRYLGRAIRRTAATSRSERVHILGYCLGGTLAAIHAAARPEKIASMALLAAPIDFHDGGILATWTSTRSFDIAAIIEAFGNIPWPLMQASFHLLKPTANLVKGVQLVDRFWDDEFLDRFIALETWGNDNVSLPGEFYRRYLEELYRGNALVRGSFYLADRPARLEEIRCPMLVVTFEHDHIVPPASASIIMERSGSTDKERIHLSGGHVGAVVSRKASETLWPRLSQFFIDREPVLSPSRRTRFAGPSDRGRTAEA